MIKLTRVKSFKTIKDANNTPFIGITFATAACCALNITKVLTSTHLHVEVYDNKMVFQAEDAHIEYSPNGIYLVID